MSFIARLLILLGLWLALLAAMPTAARHASSELALLADARLTSERSELPQGDWLHSANDQLPKGAFQRSKREGPVADAAVAAMAGYRPPQRPTPSDKSPALAIGLESQAFARAANARAPPPCGV